jgi:hypothetical protein
MAEFDALDELLSGSLKRAAQPGDSAGVADTIRARVAAGDVGTPAPSGGSAPGFGGGLGGWLPWVALVVALGLVGGTLGLTGVFGHPVERVTVAVNSILMPPTVNATSCPDGPVVASVERGSRVVALARNADGTQVQVRNPQNVSQLVWVPASQVDADTGQAAVATLPLGASCPTLYVAQPLPVVPVTPVTPTKPSKPGAPKDTTAPSEGKPTALVENCRTTITVSASDNVGVTSVSLTWTGTNTSSGPAAMSSIGGGKWQKVFLTGMHDGNTTFVAVAHDAAGNASSANSVTAFLQCLI